VIGRFHHDQLMARPDRHPGHQPDPIPANSLGRQTTGFLAEVPYRQQRGQNQRQAADDTKEKGTEIERTLHDG